ncbi:MAG TPA: hypothetical protein VFD58_23285 [Blastocatellia bacterium]|nr:hypothetical protein [Blastocatellia bacterium]
MLRVDRMKQMEHYIRIWHQEKELIVFESVARRFKLSDGQQLPPDQFLPLLEANMAHAIAICQLNRAIESVFAAESAP